MPAKKQTTESTSKKLLAPREVASCRKIASETEGIARQRAETLLSIHEGLTRTQASEKHGLTLNQIQHLITSYRSKGMALFTDGRAAKTKKTTKPAAAKAPKRAV